ncbi:hypothetical protein ACH5RR_004026 [Cinchona calisaya]|uniref:Uncharacterized protein n=1 Tax=Cinchona calisaya TaxID=153742 RepID=A0ABD3AWR5_9GENT
MTSCSQSYSTYNPCVGNKKIRVADGSLSAIAGTVTINISPSMVLHDVSFMKIIKTLNYRAIFYPSQCDFRKWSQGGQLAVLGKVEDCIFSKMEPTLDKSFKYLFELYCYF